MKSYILTVAKGGGKVGMGEGDGEEVTRTLSRETKETGRSIREREGRIGKRGGRRGEKASW